MEEKFLKLRQEREEQRQQRAKETVAITSQRQQYEAEVDILEAQVIQLLQEGSVTESQERIDALRALVQDTSNSICLTAHEMAKANSVLARLQHLVDERCSSAEPRKFKFTTRLRTKTTPEATPVTSSLQTNGTDKNESIGGAARSTSGAGNVYGPSFGADLFITHSKSAFINDCAGCTIYCLPIAGSVFLSNCTDCRVYVACHQLRLKGCADIDVYVWCASTPIIETSNAVRFGTYRCWVGLLNSSTADGKTFATHAEWVRSVGEIEDTEGTENKYTRVDDFQWVKKSASPHWRLLTEVEERVSHTTFGPATPPSSLSTHPTAPAIK